MTIQRVTLLGALLVGMSLYSFDVEGENTCAANCNKQYQATIRYCTETLTKNPNKKDWYDDCLKNAKIFRRDCLRHCH